LKNISKNKTGFLVVLVGGTGAASGEGMLEGLHVRGFQGEAVLCHIDADEGETSSVERTLSIALNVTSASELIENAAQYAPWMPDLVEKIKPFLTAADVESGAATCRRFTTAAAEYHAEAFTKFIGKAVDAILNRPGINKVQPILVGSAGGGTGSALLAIIPWLLSKNSVKGRIALGSSNKAINPPLIVAGYPVLFAKDTDVPSKATNILANCFAFSRDMPELRRGGLIQSVMICNSSNGEGVVLKTHEEFAVAVRRMTIEVILNDDLFLQRTRDVRTARHLCGYVGIDTPEKRYESVRKAMAEFYPKEYEK